MKRALTIAAAAVGFLMPVSAFAQDPMRDEIERSLRQGILEVWFPRTLDRQHGGFLCDFTYDWKASGRQPKTVVFQSRLVWLAAQGMTRYPQDSRYKEAVDHGFAFLRDRQWDAEHGGWYWSFDRAASPAPQWRDTKHAYGIGFGIYACAAHHKATKNPQSLDLAKRAFQWLEKHAHDDAHGGYYEFFAREGTRILDAGSNPLGSARDRDAIGTRLGFKSMNTHIHLLEAYAALYEVWPDERLKKRLVELLEIVRDRVTAPPGAMHQFFNPDWTPVPDLDSYGHDIENGYLLLEAAHAAGLGDDPKTKAVAKSLVDHTLDYAWDKTNGGFFEAGGTFGPVHDKRKVWWVQAEGLNALLLMSRLYPEDPRGYRRLFEQQWAYMKKNVIDPEHGEWYGDALDAGGTPKQNKSSEWKAGYHGGRALLNAVEWLGAEK